MSPSSDHQLGSSSRRSACDRCRGQKLGCLREGSDPSGRCDRCIKADATCLTTPVYHIRQYTVRDYDRGGGGDVMTAATTTPASTASNAPMLPSKKNRRHHSHNRQVAGKAYRDHGQTRSPQARSTTGLGTGNIISTTLGATTTTTSGQPQTLFNTFEWPSLDAFGKSDGGHGPVATGPAFSHDISSANWSSVVDFSATSGSVHAAAPSHAPTSGCWDAYDIHMDDYLQGPGSAPSVSTPASWAAGLRLQTPLSTSLAEDVTNQHPREPSRTQPVVQQAVDVVDPTLTLGTENARHAEMVELAHINLQLLAQLRRMVKSPPDGTLKTLVVVSEEREILPDAPSALGAAISASATATAAATTANSLLGGIMNTTRHYLDLVATMTASGPVSDSLPADLDHMHLLAAHATKTWPARPTVNSGGEPATDACASRFSGGTVMATASSPSDSSPSSGSASTSSASSPGGSAASTPPRTIALTPKTPPDASMVSLALLCYMSVLRLHVAIFAHLLNYLELVANSDHPVISPIAGFCGLEKCPLGKSPFTVSPHDPQVRAQAYTQSLEFPAHREADESNLESGNLQTIMFIQMVTNTFERMEILLGLPAEFHIGRTRYNEGGTGGFLNDGGFLEVARIMLRKEHALGRPEEGQGGMKYLRKSIKKAKRLLRSRIAP